ncbi:MAG TPA: hypothetical protein VNM40_02670 [Candidatus Paceibacterota bacterium]|nr:hypothetical protein [Candidatus Paceibacterota bacterium]
MHYSRRKKWDRRDRGVTVMLVLAFMGIFLFLLGTILSYTLMQGRYGRALYAREQALNIAEAGLEYYRWFLAHNPAILVNGNGLVSPYTHVVNDPESGRIGEATITATANLACGQVQWVDMTSVGRADISPIFQRTLAARYMRPSVAEYSALLNANVWAGNDRVISGPYFSNGGIRMDGSHNSTVQSSQATWLCDSSFGCSPTQSQNGVFGSGSNPALWAWAPNVPSFNFAGIATNFATMQTYADAQGIKLNPTNIRVGGVQQGGSFSSVGGSDQRGFRVILNANNTITVYRVTGTSAAESQHIDNLGVWTNDYHTITNQTLVGTYPIPSGCPIIYVQAKLWLEGVVGGKVTVVAADTGSYNPDIILQNNITYSSGAGSSGLTAIAERSVLVPLVSPENLTVRGIFVAQSGYFGRNYYTTSGDHDVPSSYDSYVQQGTMTTIGTVVSNGRIGTRWTCGGNFCSGYNNRIDTYDRLLAFSPPPFTPASSVDYTFVLWREQ